ncbi:ABC-2 family transporter protein [Pseudonocardia sp. MH-G8]|uniref:ABC transporter permease n=1 Tax=Pseudonocardia sp. MH-G8 TaxID=1854588 RepID=UPI000BA003FC|nr:ABC-2 family transporter protein [Pseudonocardia sp. MH-G8]OZM77679.1 ABC transporter permease [Pseudonocardia sp. MH-G8]
MLRPYLRLVRAGFRRHSTYLAASLAGLFTNTVFGLLRVAVLLAVVGETGSAAGYDAADTGTFVWLGQGLLAVVLLWPDRELALRVRSGDIAVDLSRPWNLQVALLAQDLGRAGHAVLVRLAPPVAFGALVLPFRWPENPWSVLLFAVSTALAVVISFAMRFLLDLTTFWLLDSRGVATVYASATGVLCGLTVPLAFFSDTLRITLYATPFPAMLQTPIDVFSERGNPVALLAHQALWAAVALAAGQLVLARATRKLVVQGG